MIDLKQNIQFIKGVGPARVALLNKMGIQRFSLYIEFTLSIPNPKRIYIFLN